MASTYSTNLRLELMASGENSSTWGGKLNTVIQLVEASVAGRAAVTHSDAVAYTLTANNGASDESRQMILNIGGTLTAARNTVCPTQSKLYVAKNATVGGFATTLKTSAGVGISIPNGKTTLLFCDGANVVDAIDYLSSLTIGGAFRVDGALTANGNVTLGDAAGDVTSITGTAYIGDTSNAKVTLGLTINQGANDDEILSLKSSDVAHILTSVTETDTFGRMYKVAAGSGGLAIDGMSSSVTGLYLSATAPTDDVTKTSTSSGRIVLDVFSQTGNNRAAAAANSNVAVMRASGTTLFIFDLEGSAHSEVEWTTFDTMDDVVALDALDLEMQRRNGVQGAFGEWVDHAKDALQREGVVNFYGEGRKAMFNWTRMHMLEVGAIRQLGREKADRADLLRIEKRLEALGLQ